MRLKRLKITTQEMRSFLDETYLLMAGAYTFDERPKRLEMNVGKCTYRLSVDKREVRTFTDLEEAVDCFNEL